MTTSYNKLVAASVVALAALGVVRPATAQTVYAESDAGEFGTLSLQTGVFTQLNDPNNPMPYGFAALGFAPDGTLYGLTTVNNATALFSIDPSDGSLIAGEYVSNDTINGGTIVGDTFYALSADPIDPNNPNTSATLFTVNTTTGVSNDIQTGTGIQADGLTVLDGKGNVYAADTSVSPGTNGNDGIDVISQNGTSPSPTVLGTGDTGLNYLYSGVFANNTLYGFADDGATGALGVYTISTTDGSSQLVAPITGLTGSALYAAALAPAPEPSQFIGLGLGALGLGGLALRARKRRVAA